MKKLYVLSDGWPAYLQDDGTLTDHPDPKKSDLGWDSLDQIKGWDSDVREATKSEEEYYESIQMKHEMWLKECKITFEEKV
tara:strand:- start:249 stop:491 length:243 start_codon:yes stop_codon:yes gene_type:complete